MNHLVLMWVIYLKRTNTFIRFLLVGIVNTMVGLSMMFLLLNLIGLSYWFSTFFGNATGAIISYFLNRSFTFQSNVDTKSSVLRFTAVILIAYLFSFKLSNMAAEFVSPRFYLHNILSKDEIAVFIGVGLYTLTNYLGQRLIVFAPKEKIRCP
ncbi:GtrA family protein [Lederbergia citrea]|uniref:GtrA family protein n=1 Tax=Lederbergia citrea TaxID=2833581 RepID=A0A942Z434_9BACI|nr:GtrA family protein [Lederbergia citrea]MBS4176782.1 GtrA family protein [Lederbergia citrea]MBS4203342.1 GtrA family protein [Lederbergia citrea]MBS4221985.1 GtrA family protein [Lederbergia citrea]